MQTGMPYLVLEFCKKKKNYFTIYVQDSTMQHGSEQSKPWVIFDQKFKD